MILYDNLKMIFRCKTMQTISVKELRNNFPEVIQAIQAGESYTLIYRSKPVAQIKPISSSQEAFKKLLELRTKVHFISKKNAVELIREERN